jgi:protein-S-isoprenylcysteine O-methyltransferase Ste14
MAATFNSIPFDQKKRIKLLQVFGLFAIASLLFSRPVWMDDQPMREVLEFSGYMLVFICVFGRLWSILFVGSRKNSELVTNGPYSITRNPLYFFSTLGVIGIGLACSSIIVAATLGIMSYLVFSFTARKESEFLKETFPTEYRTYAANTPMFFPNINLYKDGGDTTFSPKALFRTFIDVLAFFIALPLIEGLEFLHESEQWPTFVSLY